MKKSLIFMMVVFSLLSGCTNTEGATLPAAETVTSETSNVSTDTTDRGEPDFGNSYWNDSMEQVFKQEGGGLWRLCVNISEFAGLDALTFLNFDSEGLLCGGRYTAFSSQDISKFSAYKTVQEHLNTSYGEAETKAFYASDGSPLPDLQSVIDSGGWSESEWRPAVSGGKDRTAISLKWLRDGDVQVDFFASGTAEKGDTPDFRQSYWGDTMEQVLNSEGDGFWQLEVVSKLAGFDVPTYFVFEEGENVLQFVFYDLTDSDMDGRTKYEKYELARDQMVSLYGEPEHELFAARDGTILSSLNGSEEANASWILRTPVGDRRSAVTLSMGKTGLSVAIGSLI